MNIDIFKKYLNKANNNPDLAYFFDGYIDCLLCGANAMYWHIPDDNILKNIKDFFAEVYKNNPELYSVKLWNSNPEQKEYEIVWFYSIEHKNSLNR